jgi:hypothetical protein
MEAAERFKKMLAEGTIAASDNLMQRALNDQLTHDDINFLKRNFNMLDWAQEEYSKRGELK